MLNVNGERRRPLGEVENLEIQIGECNIPIDVIVSEANVYSVIVGNDWLSKAQAKVDWNKSIIKIKYNNNKIQVPIEFRNVTNLTRAKIKAKDIPESDDDDEEEEEEDNEEEEEESKYKEKEDLEERLFTYTIFEEI